jgi:hypothetical protein
MNYIAHHGIKGQKWGVRRYQNFDGSYTQAGLKRYRTSQKEYMDARSRYKNTKAAYKSGSASEDDLRIAKKNLKIANRNANATYRQLRRDMKADKGKDLYARGKTIEEYNTQQKYVNWGIASVGGAATMALAASGKRAVIKLGKTTINTPAAELAALATTGAIVAGAIVYGKKRGKMRAYYGHSRPTVKPLQKINDKKGNE